MPLSRAQSSRTCPQPQGEAASSGLHRWRFALLLARCRIILAHAGDPAVVDSRAPSGGIAGRLIGGSGLPAVAEPAAAAHDRDKFHETFYSPCRWSYWPCYRARPRRMRQQWIPTTPAAAATVTGTVPAPSSTHAPTFSA